MQSDLFIRIETPADFDAITDVTIAAFDTLEISEHTEQFIIRELRSTGALTLSLVAELDGEVVGHIAFSPIIISDGTTNWYGVGPLSVIPALHKQGIGSALMREGLAQMKAFGANGCCLVGHPGYYDRFGFTHPQGLVLEGVPGEAFFALSFNGPIPQGEVTFHKAFFATE